MLISGATVKVNHNSGCYYHKTKIKKHKDTKIELKRGAKVVVFFVVACHKTINSL